MQRRIIAVIGDGSIPEGDDRYQIAMELGRLLVENGYTVMNGGRGGIMEAVTRGARNSRKYHEGAVIGILPDTNRELANRYLDTSITSGLGTVRNHIIAHSDAVIAIGGGAGTLSEMALAWQFGRLLVAFRVEGWSGKLADKRIDDRTRHTGIVEDRVFGCGSPEEAIGLLETYLDRYLEDY